MSDAAITFTDVTYRYRDRERPALDGLTLEVPCGEFVAILGPTGAGKSTLAAAINGLVPHFFKGRFRGDVTVLGQSTAGTGIAQMALRVGIVFQDFEGQLFSTSAELEVAFGPENFGVPRDEIARRVNENLALVDLLPLKKRHPSTLSGGQKQRLAIASALALEPEVLVMDEPTSDLDPVGKAEVLELRERLRERGDLTLLAVEHETEELVGASRCVLMREGRIEAEGPADEILRDVDALSRLGLMVPGVADYFHRMGVTPVPLTPEEGAHVFTASGWRIDEDRSQALAASDACRRDGYGDTIIRCEGLSFVYPNGVRALHGIDLVVRRGEMIAIAGQNGGGKTTLAKHFNGLLVPTSGRVTVDGTDTREAGVFALGKRVGYVFQNPDHQIFSETVYDEVALTLRLQRLGEVEISRRVAESLEAVDLTGMEREDPFALDRSGRKRVAVASVLAAGPEVLILDEPTTGLDHAGQRSMMEMVKGLNARGTTVVFITHHMWAVAAYALRMLVVNDGRVVMDAPPRDVFARGDILREARLKPPHIVELSTRLGSTLLTVDEMVACTDRGGAS